MFLLYKDLDHVSDELSSNGGNLFTFTNFECTIQTEASILGGGGQPPPE